MKKTPHHFISVTYIFIPKIIVILVSEKIRCTYHTVGCKPNQLILIVTIPVNSNSIGHITAHFVDSGI